MIRYCLVLIVGLLAGFACASRARADMGIPAGNIDFTLLFQNLSDYPDYDFYLKYGRSPGDPASKVYLTKVEAGTVTRLEGSSGRHTDIVLVALPRGQKLPVPENNGRLWLKDPPSGGLQSAALKGDPAGHPLVNGYDVIYQVRIEGGQLEVECVEANLNEWWRNARLTAILVGAACLLIPIAILAFFIVLIVRYARRP